MCEQPTDLLREPLTGIWGVGIAILAGLALAAALQHISAALLGARRRAMRLAFAAMALSAFVYTMLGVALLSSPDVSFHAAFFSYWMLSFHPIFVAAPLFVAWYAEIRLRTVPVAIMAMVTFPPAPADHLVPCACRGEELAKPLRVKR